MPKIKVWILIVLMFGFPLQANDEEIIKMLDFLESYELLDDENFDEMVEDQVSQMDGNEDEE